MCLVEKRETRNMKRNPNIDEKCKYFTNRSLKKSAIFYIPIPNRIFFFVFTCEGGRIQLYERLYAFIIRFLFNPTVMTGAKLFCDR